MRGYAFGLTPNQWEVGDEVILGLWSSEEVQPPIVSQGSVVLELRLLRSFLRPQNKYLTLNLMEFEEGAEVRLCLNFLGNSKCVGYLWETFCTLPGLAFAVEKEKKSSGPVRKYVREVYVQI